MFYLKNQCVPRSKHNSSRLLKTNQPPLFSSAVLRLRQLVACLSPRKPGFGTRLFHVRFLMDKGALKRSFSPSTSVCPLGIIPQVPHTHLYLHVALNRRTNGQSLETIQKAIHFRKSRRNRYKSTFSFLCEKIIAVYFRIHTRT